MRTRSKKGSSSLCVSFDDKVTQFWLCMGKNRSGTQILSWMVVGLEWGGRKGFPFAFSFHGTPTHYRCSHFLSFLSFLSLVVLDVWMMMRRTMMMMMMMEMTMMMTMTTITTTTMTVMMMTDDDDDANEDNDDDYGNYAMMMTMTIHYTTTNQGR